jgi:hypothetical protein
MTSSRPKPKRLMPVRVPLLTTKVPSISAAYAMAKSEVYIATTNLYDFNSILELASQFPHVARQEESHCWTFFIKG